MRSIRILFLYGLLLRGIVLSGQSMTSVSVDPPTPGDGDYVSFLLEGTFADDCSFFRTQFLEFQGDTIYLGLGLDNAPPCNSTPTPFTQVVKAGFFQPGDYQLVVHSLDDGSVLYQMPFSVSDGPGGAPCMAVSDLTIGYQFHCSDTLPTYDLSIEVQGAQSTLIAQKSDNSFEVYSFNGYFLSARPHGVPCIDPGQSRNLAPTCAPIFDPVCGCNGISYNNACEALELDGIVGPGVGTCPPNAGGDFQVTGIPLDQTLSYTLTLRYSRTENTGNGPETIHTYCTYDLQGPLSDCLQLSLSPADTLVNHRQGCVSLLLQANWDWQLESSASWVQSITPSSGGSGNHLVEVCYAYNDTPTARSAPLVAAIGSRADTALLHQAARPFLTPQPDTLHFPPSDTCLEFSLESNVPWSLGGGAPWVTSIVPAGGGPDSLPITVCVEANGGLKPRATELLLSATDTSLLLPLFQASTISPPPWTVTPTSRVHRVLLVDTLVGDLDGLPLELGDYLGFFYRRPNGEEALAGFGQWTGNNDTVLVYGNELPPPDQNGFLPGERFRLRLWDASALEEKTVAAGYLPVGALGGAVTDSSRFAQDGFSAIDSLVQIFRQVIPLRKGWNSVSSYIRPRKGGFEHILGDLLSEVILVKDMEGRVFYPSWNFDQLDNWVLIRGYQIKTRSDTVLVLEGPRVRPDERPIPLQPGWQMVAYLRDSPSPIASELAGIAPALDLALDDKDDAYAPAQGVNEIGDLLPGKGYKLKLNAPAVLTYSPNLQPSTPPAFKGEGEGKRGFAPCTPQVTEKNATLLIPADAELLLDGQPLPLGSSLSVQIPGNGGCAGSVVWEGLPTALPVFAEDDFFPGLAPGTPYDFRITLPDGCVVDSVQVTFRAGPDFGTDHFFQPDALQAIERIEGFRMRVEALPLAAACDGEPEGSAGVEWLVSGTAPYSFQWSNGQSGDTLRNALPGTYQVTVTDANQCSAQTEVTIPQAPSPTLELGPDRSTCDVPPLLLQPQTDATQFSWSTGQSSESIEVAQSGTYSLTVTNSEGCTATDSLEVTFLEPPLVNLGPDTTHCAGPGQGLMLDAGGGGVQYDWFLNEVPVGNGTATLEVTASGSYRVEVTAANGCSAGDEVEVSLFAQPQVELGAEQLQACSDALPLLDAGAGADSYQWFLDGQPLPGADQPTLQTSTPGTYRVEVSNGGVCHAGDSVLLEVVAQPIVELGAAQQSACEGQTLLLQGSVQGESLQWFLDGQPLPGAQSDTLRVELSGTYRLEALNGGLCSAADEVAVTFFPQPQVALGADTSLCEGSSLTLDAGPADDYQWFLDGNPIPGAVGRLLAAQQSGRYRVEVNNGGLCFDEDEVEVLFQPLPTVELSPADTQICEGSTLSLQALSDAVQFQWMLDGIPLPGEEQPTLSVQAGGTYTVLVSSAFGCQSTAQSHVIVSPLPQVSLPADSIATCGDSLPLFGSSDAAELQWFLNGQPIAGANGTTLQAEVGGWYTLQGTNPPGCQTRDSLYLRLKPLPTTQLKDVEEVCPGDTLLLQPGDFAQYRWSDGSTQDHIAIASPKDNPVKIGKLYWVEVTDYEGCKNRDSVEVFLLPVVRAVAQPTEAILCPQDTLPLQASGGLHYRWWPDSSLNDATLPNPLATPEESTLYFVEVSDDCPENKDTALVDVFVYERLATAGNDTCVSPGVRIVLQASGALSYEWLDLDAYRLNAYDIPNPRARVTHNTTFVVRLTDANGCTYLDSVNVAVISNPLDFVTPINTLTPNGDGINDVLEFEGLEKFSNNSLKVLNRWGNVVFEKLGYQEDEVRFDGTYQGKPLPAGTYFYILNLAGFEIKQTLVLIRE